MPRPLYIERVLFIVGLQDAGKSTQLRRMFCDHRFGTRSHIPSAAQTPETIYLSNERRLYIKFMSAHETGETLEQYFERIEEKTRSGRWNFAGALQPNPARRISQNLVEIVAAFNDRFSPERIRLCFLSPDRHNRLISDQLGLETVIPQLGSLGNVECIFIDTYHIDTPNGLIPADFFDFT